MKKNKNILIQEIGTAGCEYTGGGIWIAYIPVEIEKKEYYITLDSESESIDKLNGGEFLICNKFNFNLIEKYGDKGVFIFDNNSQYMIYYNKLKKILLKALKNNKPIESRLLK